MIELDGLSFTPAGSDQPILSDVRLRIGPGERVGIAGPSGSGKSTLGYHLCGAHRLALAGKTSGRLHLDGRDCLDGAPCGFAGLVGQNPEAQLFCRTVNEELTLALRIRGETEARCRETADALLGRYGFASRRDAPVGRLSLGQKQQTAILSMLAIEPKVLLLDEPTSYLDAAASDRLFAHLKELCRCHGWIVLVIEHDIKRLADFADRVLVMSKGRLVHDGSWASCAVPGAAAMAADLPDFSPVGPEEPAIACSGLGFGYGEGEPVLTDIAFSVRPGESVALLGPNGAGKTSLLRLIKGLAKPSSGRMALGPGLVASRDVGLMFQNPDDQIFAHTVEAECGYWLDNLGVPRAERAERCRRFLAQLGLAGMDERAPFSLSFGEKRRLCLASTLVAEPAVLCMDEPTTGLDNANMTAMAGLVRRLAASGTAVVFATHEDAFAAMAASRWISLQNGRIVSDRPNPHVAK